MSPSSSTGSRLSSRYYRPILSFLVTIFVLLLIYVAVKVISGAGAFFDIIAILSILILALPERIRFRQRRLSVLRTGFLSIELLIMLALVGSQWLAWQLIVALFWIKVFNILAIVVIGGLEFQTVQDGFRRRVIVRRRGQSIEARVEDEPRPRPMERRALIATIIILIVGVPVFFGVMAGTTAVLGNASYFDGMVTKNTGYPSFFTFNSSDVRLVTEDVAYAKAKQHMASFGSNVQVENAHITVWDGKLSWTMTVVQQYWLGASYDQHVYGYIVLSATDPNEAPLLVHQELALATGTGLNSRKDVLLQCYYRDPNYKYDRAILTKTAGGELVYAVPKYTIEPSLSMKSYGVDIVDALTGNYLGSYDLASMPAWVPQPFDEGWLESQVTNWGASRRGSSFDIFAGGFIGVSVSNDRVAMDEDTRFLRYGEEMISFTSMHPYATEQTLSGIFVSDHTGIKYYDVSQSNMLSASRAKDVIQSQLYKPSGGEFVVEMPILYNVTGYMAWLSPVYYLTGDTWQLKFIGIVNALDQSDVITQDVTGISARIGVETTTASFISLVSSKQNAGTSIQGTIAGKWSYEVGGNTNYYLNMTYDSTWLLLHGAESSMPAEDWVDLVISSTGNQVNCTYIVVGSSNEITRFNVLDF